MARWCLVACLLLSSPVAAETETIVDLRWADQCDLHLSAFLQATAEVAQLDLQIESIMRQLDGPLPGWERDRLTMDLFWLQWRRAIAYETARHEWWLWLECR